MDGEPHANSHSKKNLADIISWEWITDTSVNEIYIFEETSLKFIKANRAALTNLGYTADEFTRLTPLDIKTDLSPEDFGRLLQKLRDNGRQQIVFSSVHRRKDGTTYPVKVHLHLARHPQKNLFVAIIQDMSLQLLKEAALQQSQTEYRVLTEHLPGIIARFDRQYRYIYVSSKFYDYTGSLPKDFISRSVRETGFSPETAAQFEHNIDQVYLTGSPFSQKLTYTKNNCTRTFLSTFIPEKNSRGQVETVLTSSLDITASETANDRLRQSEALFATIFDMVPSPTILLDDQGNILKANKKFFSHTGLSRKRAVGQSIKKLGLLSGHELEWIKGALIQERQIKDLPYEFKPSRKNRYTYGTLDIVPIKAAGQSYALALFTDTTAQHEAQQFLHLQHELAVSLAAADSLADGIALILDAVLQIRDIDSGAVYLINAETRKAELQGTRGLLKKFTEQMPDIDPDSPHYHYFTKTEPRYLTRARARKTIPHFAENTGIGACAIIPVCENSLVSATFLLASTSRARFDQETRDKLEILTNQLNGIIARIRAQENSRKSKKRYQELNSFLRMVSDNIPDPIWAKDMDNRYTFANQALCDIILKCNTPTEVIGHTDIEFAEKERAGGQQHTFGEICIDSDQVTQETRKPCRFFEDGLVRGRYIALDVHKAPLWDGSTMIGTVGCGRDITALKASETALQKAHDELEHRVTKRTHELKSLNRKYEQEIAHRSIVEKELRIKDSAIAASITPFSLSDLNGHLVYGNNALFSLFGFRGNEFLGTYLPNHFVAPQKALRSLNKKGSWIGNIDIRRKDNSTCPVRFMGNLIHDDNGTPLCFVGSYIDMRPINNLQQKLVRSERLAATGQLAASVAHEINSPLQGIRALLNVIEQTHNQDQELLDHILLIRQAFTRIKNTVISLMDLNRPGNELKQMVDLNCCIMDISGLMNSLLRKKNIDLTLDLTEDLPQTMASPLQLGQVLMNLINNAAEAMEDQRGDVPRQIRVATAAKGSKISISVSDTGPGIPSDILESIFDPFVTRKRTLGMGVGLAICNGIIEDHGGIIAARNRPDLGAEFEITLPVKEDNNA